MSEYKDTGISDLIKAFGGKMPSIKIGILGKNAREGGGTNSEIGLKHEFGKDGMPVRSFLRMPLIENLGKYLENAGAFNEEVLKEVIEQKSILTWMKKIGVTAERVVADGFDSGGFGKWKPSNMSFKKNKQTLVETQQLRNSITSEVK